MNDPWSQRGYRCRLEWGRRGARVAAERGDILVVVDVLSFSTATVTAVQHGGVIRPCAWTDDPAALAAGLGAEAAVHRRDVPAKGRFSLSPPTFNAIEPGTRVVLASPNGATCAQYGKTVPHLLVGALVNARAVSEAVAGLLASTSLNVTVLACGERWQLPSEDGDLRFAIEDYLGAGAILSGLPAGLSRSPEAAVCQAAFAGVSGDIARTVWESGSGLELREAGFPEDVDSASQVNEFTAVPRMVNGWLLA
ncbi:MAG: 2-phosphosulfolactate phosphatase [Chloroflexota bacterium]